MTHVDIADADSSRHDCDLWWTSSRALVVVGVAFDRRSTIEGQSRISVVWDARLATSGLAQQ